MSTYDVYDSYSLSNALSLATAGDIINMSEGEYTLDVSATLAKGVTLNGAKGATLTLSAEYSYSSYAATLSVFGTFNTNDMTINRKYLKNSIIVKSTGQYNQTGGSNSFGEIGPVIYVESGGTATFSNTNAYSVTTEDGEDTSSFSVSDSHFTTLSISTACYTASVENSIIGEALFQNNTQQNPVNLSNLKINTSLKLGGGITADTITLDEGAILLVNDLNSLKNYSDFTFKSSSPVIDYFGTVFSDETRIGEDFYGCRNYRACGSVTIRSGGVLRFQDETQFHFTGYALDCYGTLSFNNATMYTDAYTTSGFNFYSGSRFELINASYICNLSSSGSISFGSGVNVVMKNSTINAPNVKIQFQSGCQAEITGVSGDLCFSFSANANVSIRKCDFTHFYFYFESGAKVDLSGNYWGGRTLEEVLDKFERDNCLSYVIIDSVLESLDPEFHCLNAYYDKKKQTVILTFSEDLNEEQNVAELLSIVDNEGGASCNIISATAQGKEIEVKFEPVDDVTGYTINVLPSLLSKRGSKLDQNNNGEPGEETDGFSGKFDLFDNGFVVSDFTVSSSSVTCGDELSISLTLTNLFYDELPEPATVGIYLSTDNVFDVGDQLLTQLTFDSLNDSGEEVDFTLSTLGIAEGDYYLISRAASATEAKENNAAVEDHKNLQSAQLAVEIPSLTVGGSINGAFSKSNTSDIYKLKKDAGDTVRISLTQSGACSSEVFVGYGFAPTRELFSEKTTVSGSGEIILPKTGSDTDVYILVNDKNRQPGEYVLSAEKMSTTILSVSPATTAVNQDILLEVRGTVFSKDSRIIITDSSGKIHSLDTTFVDDTYLIAEIEANELSADTYTLSVKTGDNTVDYDDPIQLISSGEADFQYKLILPNGLGNHIISEIYFEYTNEGTVAMDAPLVYITAEQNGGRHAIMTLDESRLTTGFWTYNLPDGYTNTISVLATGETGSLLQPGMETQSISIFWAGWQKPWDFSYPPFKFKVAVVDSTNTDPVDWNALLANTGFPAEYKAKLVAALKANIGTTLGDYVSMLNRNLRQMKSLGVTEQLSAEDLLKLELASINGANSPAGTLAGGTDIALNTQGLSLSFSRTKGSAVTGQYQDGVLGYGWSTNWDGKLEVDDDGTVYVTVPEGSTYSFEPTVTNGYVSFSNGVSLTVSGGVYIFTDADKTKYGFASNGRLSYVKDVNGNTINAVYSGSLLTKLEHSDGSFLSFTYDQNNRIATVSGSNGDKATYTYDANGNLTSVRNADGNTVESYTYDNNFVHNLASATSLTGSTTQYTYDSYGRLTGTTLDGQDNALTISYDGATTTVTNQSGYTYSQSFDPNGNVLRTADSFGNELIYTYDASGNLVKKQDADGNTVTYTYDSKGNCISVTDAMNRKTSYVYSGGNVQSVTDSNGNTLTYIYDKKNRVTGIKSSNGTSVSMSYDDAGNMISYTDVKKVKSVMTYDERGNMLSLSRDGKTVSFAYDANGNRTSAVDALGKTMSYEYDSNNRMTAFVDANGSRTTYAYDAAGNVNAITYANGKSEQYATDLYGNVISWTNMRGETVTATVDSLGRIASTFVAGKDCSYTYDSRGLITSADDMTFVYDRSGRLTSMSYSDGRRVSYEYNAAGQLIAQSDETGAGSVYSYDANGNIDKITDKSGSLIIDYDFNRLGQLVRQTNGNGTSTTWSYTIAGEVERIGYYDAEGALTGFCEYTFDNDGLCTMKTTESGVWAYVYDNNGQLLSEVFTDNNDTVTQNNSYTYDAAGNRLTKTINGVTTAYTYNNMNQIVSANGFAYRYDADGNLLEDEERVYTWTKDNRVASETLKSTGQVWTYGYDALGNRTSVTTNGVTTNYTVDVNGNVLSEYVNGVQTRRYRQGLSLIGFTTADGAYYFNADLQGSTLSVTDAGGASVNAYAYDAFGNVLSAAEGVANDFEFVGGCGLMANASGTIFVRARNYDAATGRWLSMDPIGISGGNNLYVYCGNNPVSYVDVNGNSYCPVHGYYDDGNLSTAADVVSDHLGTVNNMTLAAVPKVSGANQLLTSVNIFKYIKAGYDNDGFMGAVYGVYEGTYRVFGGAIGTVGGMVSGALVGGVDNWNKLDGTWGGQLGYSWGVVKEAYHGGVAGGKKGSETMGYIGRKTAQGITGAKCNHSTPMCDKDNKPGEEENISNEMKKDAPYKDSGGTDGAGSYDPNDMIGPKGYGENHAIADGSTLTYTVMCENDPELANAPVRWLRINSTLDENLDLDTFTIDAFFIAGNYVKLDAGLDSYNQRREMTINDVDVTLDFSINLDTETRELKIEVMAIDPATDFMLQDSTVGFLYPNDASGVGDAYFVYTLKAKDGLANGTVITNKADIFFDFNDVIPTPEYSNLIDTAAPAIGVPVASEQGENMSRQVSWNGSDGAGAGIAWYTVEIARNGGEWETLYANTIETGTEIKGAGAYRLRVKATDALGFESGWSDVLEFTTRDMNAGDLQDLGFHQPQGWYSKAVIAPDAKKDAEQTLLDYQPLYLSYCVDNDGADSMPYSVETYIDGDYYCTTSFDGLAFSATSPYEGLTLGAFAAGEHSVTMKIVSEEEDALPHDNVYSRTFTVEEDDARGTFYETYSCGNTEMLDDHQALSLETGKYVISGNFIGGEDGKKVNAKVVISNSAGTKVGTVNIRKGKIASNVFLLTQDDYDVQVISSDKQKTADRVTVSIFGQINYKANADDDRIDRVSELPYAVTVRNAPRALIAGDWVGFGDAVDYRQLTFEHSGKYSLTVKASGQLKISLVSISVDAKGRKKEKNVFSTTVSGKKLGTDVKFNGIILEAGTYYLKAESTNAKKGGSSDYSVLLNENSVFFDKGDNSDDWTDLRVAGAAGKVGDAGAIDGPKKLLEDWVGFGDAVDYNKFSIASMANLSFSVSAGDAVKFTIWKLNETVGKTGVVTYSLKSLQSMTIRKGKDGNYSGTSNTLLLEAGDYYFSVESPNAAKGGSADYSVSVKACEFFTQTDNRDDWTDLRVAGAAGKVGDVGAIDAQTKELLEDWVGFGDAVDYKKFSLASAANLSFSVSARDAVKFTIWKLNETVGKTGVVTYSLKSLQSMTLKKGQDGNYSGISSTLLLGAGDYYFSVESTNAAKGGNAAYSVSVNACELFTKGDNSDDWTDLKVAGAAGKVGNVGAIDAQTKEILVDWVGFGDAVDYKKFSLASAAELSFSVSAGDAVKFTVWTLNETVGKTGVVTYSLKSLQTMTLRKGQDGNYSGASSPLLFNAGDYYFSVESPNAAKGGSAAYRVSVNKAKTVFFTDADNGWNNWLYDRKTGELNEAVEFSDPKWVTPDTEEILLDEENSVCHEDGSGKVWHNYVGYGDEADFTKLSLRSEAKLSFTINATDALKFTIYTLIENVDKNGVVSYSLKELHSAALKDDGNGVYTHSVTMMIPAEAFYISVQSAGANGSKYGYYNIKINQKRSSFYDYDYACAGDLPFEAQGADAPVMPASSTAPDVWNASSAGGSRQDDLLAELVGAAGQTTFGTDVAWTDLDSIPERSLNENGKGLLASL